MRARRRIHGVLVAFLTALASIAVVTPTASAHYSQCGESSFCMWEHSSYEGMYYYRYGSTPYVGNDFNDKATSAWNRLPVWVTVYEHRDYQSSWYPNPFPGTFYHCLSIAPGASSVNFLNVFNDKASSVRVNHREPQCVHYQE